MPAMQRYRKIRRWTPLHPVWGKRVKLISMNNVSDKLRMSLLKKQEALNKFKVRKEAFLLSKEQIKKDIEEARTIWKTTLEQIPKQPFDQ